MDILVGLLNKTVGEFSVWGLDIEARYWQAIAIVILLFLLIFTLARMRYLYIHWNLGKSSLSFLFYGFLIAIILEGFLIIRGKTLVTELLGWQNAPKPISTALDVGRGKLVDVLGASENSRTPEQVINDYKNLTVAEAVNARNEICKPN